MSNLTLRNRTTRGLGGYTLLELLLAMSLFSALGVGMISLLSRTSSFLTKGASDVETLDAIQTFTEAFEADITKLATQPASDVGMPHVRLYADVVPCKIDDADELADANIQRLFFVRFLPNEATSRLTRNAGTSVEADAYLDQEGDLGESVEGKLKATGGLQEVFWTAVPETQDDLAVMKLYRGFRSPIGGDDSLLPRAWARYPQSAAKERGVQHRAEIVKLGRPVLAGVLYFGVEFWSRKTNTWAADTRPGQGGALRVWDSTRGIIPQGEGYEGFYYSKLGRELEGEPSSLQDPTDDTFPRRVRVTVVVEEVGRNAAVGRLAMGVGEDDRILELEDAQFIPLNDTNERFVKIGSEWISFENIEGRTLTGCKRGRRGTVAMSHGAAARVHHGKTVTREYDLATYRDAYRDELPTIAGRR